jgi:AcrR family transcriptional regulator
LGESKIGLTLVWGVELEYSVDVSRHATITKNFIETHYMPWNSLSFESDSVEHLAPYRRPSQVRGEAKFDKLLDAAHSLIEEQGVEEFSLADVAKRAGVATGSAYHFFPNLEAIFIALVERYDIAFAEIVSKPIEASAVDSWADILELHFEKARQFINANPPALILIIGPGRSWQSKQVDTIGDSNIAIAMVETIERLFVLPTQPPAAQLLHLGIRMLEGLWELSVQQHGHVTRQFSRETTRAVVAYLRLYWPTYLERKNP